MSKMLPYWERRQVLLEQMPASSIFVLYGASLQVRNADNDYPFRQDSDFYYCTGWPEPEAVMVLHKTAEGAGSSALFCLPKDPKAEQWTGRRLGPAVAMAEYGFDHAGVVTEYVDYIKRLLVDTVYATQLDPALEALGGAWKNPSEEGLAWLHHLRLIKDAGEMHCIQQSVAIAEWAHRAAMRYCKPGLFEYQVEAVLRYEAMQAGARECAYGPIVAGGENACILHYDSSASKLNEGDLLLVDFGVEYGLYASDITRTFPVNGRFSPQQAQLYTVVLEAQLAVIDGVKPGVTWAELEALAVQVLTAGLQAIGEFPEDIKYYYPHSIGHFLGLDVHDVGPYKKAKKSTALEAGMVITVEPGLYLPEQRLGIRIEDNVLVTETGYKVLSDQLPKSIAAIEEACRG